MTSNGVNATHAVVETYYGGVNYSGSTGNNLIDKGYNDSHNYALSVVLSRSMVSIVDPDDNAYVATPNYPLRATLYSTTNRTLSTINSVRVTNAINQYMNFNLTR